jgi:hypothetical protein
MFERISNSWALAMSSWRVLKTDKKLVLFPLVSGAALLLVLASFAVPFALLARNGWIDDVQQNGVPVWVYAVTFLFYYCNYFVIVFFNSALTSCALMRLNGDEPRLGDGFRMAFSRLPQIAAWALVAATVGMLLKMIESAHEKAGQIISAVLGTAWSIMTFFVVPVLVVEKVGPFAAISRSVAILKKTWGESLVGTIGLGLLTFLLVLPGILLIAGGVWLMFGAEMFAVGLVVIGVAVLYLIGVSLVTSALQSIYLAAMYQYAAHDRVPQGFDREMLAGAIKAKPSGRVSDDRIM